MILSVLAKGGFSMLAWETGDLRHPEIEIIPELLVRTVAGVKTACFRSQVPDHLATVRYGEVDAGSGACFV